jgi:ribosome recycling factor
MERNMLDKIMQTAEDHMQKSIEILHNDFVKIRTGRAHPSLIEHIMVPYYGNDTPLNQVAAIAVEDSRTLTVTPWEKPLIPIIEKAIMQADLGLNPATSGQVIRVPLPPLTEERRRDMAKLIKSEAENTKVAVRNIRRDANSQAKALEKDKAISEDEERGAEERIQKLTDKYIAEIDKMVVVKEKELMTV